MKRFLLLFLSAVMLLSMVACNASGGGETSATTDPYGSISASVSVSGSASNSQSMASINGSISNSLSASESLGAAGDLEPGEKATISVVE